MTRAHDEPFSYIHPEVRHFATASDDVRARVILTDRWVDYPDGKAVIDWLFEMADAQKRERPQSGLIWGAPNVGKTRLQHHFTALHRERSSQGVRGQHAEILWLELSAGLNEKRLYILILNALRAPAPDTTAARLLGMVIRHLEARDVRLLLFDELQRITRLPHAEQWQVLEAIRYISSRLSISIAGFGSGETRALIDADAHLSERFEIMELPSWTRRRKWVAIAVREKIAYFPLRHPTAVDAEFMVVLMRLARGVPGRIFTLLERAAVGALGGEERITTEALEAAARPRGEQ